MRPLLLRTQLRHLRSTAPSPITTSRLSRPALSSTKRSAARFATTQPVGLRSMASNPSTSASTSAPLQEWLVLAPDHQGALEKRLSVRAQHLEGLKADPETFWLWGGATLAEPLAEGVPPKMTGSAMLIGAKTKEDVIERLKRDVYVSGEVWDWEKVQIVPFKSALRKAL